MVVLEKDELEQAFLDYYQDLYRLAYRLSGDYAEAEDVIQDAFLKAWLNKRRFRHDSTLKTWLYRIVVNTTFSWRRRWYRRRRKLVTFFLDWDTRKNWDDQNYAERQLEQLQLNQRLAGALQELPPLLRLIVVLRDIEGLKYEEIATIVNIPMGTVKSRLWRARRALKAQLEAQMHVVPDAHVERGP